MSLLAIALGLVVAVQGAAGDLERGTGPATRLEPNGSVVVRQEFDVVRYPGCPVRLAGMRPWRATYRPKSITCLLSARTHAWEARVRYVQWPRRGRSLVVVRTWAR